MVVYKDHQMAGLIMDVVMVDHCYSKPWSAHPDASNARPLRTVYMGKFPRGTAAGIPKKESDSVIDVTSIETNIPSYDVCKARMIMNECEKHVSSLKDEADWEEQINRTGWTPQQNWLVNKAIKIFHGDRLVRLAYENNITEPVMRRINVDKTAKRFRQALASLGWDTKLIQWLHGVLMDNLGVQYLAAYLDVLQTLKAKIPHLIDRMVCGHTSGKLRAPNLTGEPLAGLIKRPWDPVLSAYSQNKMRKLPFNPLILVAPSGPTTNNSLQSKRMRYYTSQLSSLGKVIPVTMHTVNGGSGVSIAQCLEHMIGAVKTKVAELKGHFVNRPIVLMGWNIGALVSSHVALQESVSAVVCLGFPFTGVGGGRGDADDPLLESRTPTLFVVGQHATTCTIDEMEDIREKMKADNSLLVVGGADDHLRMSRAKKKQENLTQIMVDKSILDEVSEFLGGILSQGPVIHESVIVDLSEVEYKKKKKHQTNVMVDLDYTSGRVSSQSTPHSMTIANALRARALANSVSVDINKFGDSSNVSPIRVKRKYTKRKAPTKPVTAAPRKRFKSNPTPPVASPISSSIPTPLSAGLPLSTPSTPELSGLFKTNTGLLPSLVLEDGSHKSATYTATKLPSTQPEQAKTYNLPSPSILGSSNEPMIAYRIEDYYKRFGPPQETNLSKPTISIEGLLQTPGPSFIGEVSSPLHPIGRHRPQVHVTAASTMASHIHQLLASMSKSVSLPSIPMVSSTSSPTVSQSTAYSPSKLTPQLDSLSPGGLTAAQLSQSGSPLQNSVPTLMSSLNKNSGFNINNMIKIITSSANTQDMGEKKILDESKIQTSQTLQFHDFPKLLNTSTDPNALDKSAPISLSAGTQEQYGSFTKLVDESSSILSKTDEVFSHMMSSIATSRTSSNPDPFSRPHVPSAGLEHSSSYSTSSLVGSSTPVPQDRPARIMSSSAGEETLGKVSSLLESSPVTGKPSMSSIRSNQSTPQRSHAVHGVNVTVVTGSSQKSTAARNPSPTITSYAVTPKQSLSTLAATRTRRIRTPKQFDL